MKSFNLCYSCIHSMCSHFNWVQFKCCNQKAVSTLSNDNPTIMTCVRELKKLIRCGTFALF